MALDTVIKDNSSGVVAGVTSANELKVNATGDLVFFAENDAGIVTGERLLLSPEVDGDYRIRIAHETFLDQETFNYTAQNTGKHRYFNTGMTNAWSLNGLQTNSGAGATVANNSTLVASWAYFPLHGVATTYFKYNVAFNQSTFPTNTIADFGAFISINTAAVPTNPYAPVDGAYFRVTSSGIIGVINFGGAETVTSPFVVASGGANWTPVINKRYSFLIAIGENNVQFWINDELYATTTIPDAQGQPFISTALPLAIRHAVTGVPSSTFSLFVSDTTVSIGGPAIADRASAIGSRTLGSYQGLSGGTMGSLAAYANSAAPTSVSPTQVAAVVTGLGGQSRWNLAGSALTFDYPIFSYQVPFGTTNLTGIQGRRLVVRGIGLGSIVTTALTGGGYAVTWFLAFGGTSLNLAQAEGATAKAFRRIALPTFNQTTLATQAAGLLVNQPGGTYIDFGDAPVYVNPGEFIILGARIVAGTLATVGTIDNYATFTYGWE